MAIMSSVDLIVGIPSYNEADTIGGVVRAVDCGLERYFPHLKSLIVNVDNNSPDNTKEAFLSIETKHKKEYISTPEGVKGKGYNLRNLFTLALEKGAKAVAVIDGDIQSITPEWVRDLASPVLNDGRDFVTPLYTRHQFDGTLTNHICYPVVFGLLSTDIRQPIGGEFAFSPAMIKYWLSREWKGSFYRYGIDIFMTVSAVLGGFKVGQVYLGSKVHKASAPKLGQMFEEVVDTLFTLLMDHKDKWINKTVEDIVIPPSSGEKRLEEPQELSIDIRDLKRKCHESFEENKETLKELLDPYSFVRIQEMIEMDYYDLDLLLWTQLFYTLLYTYDQEEGERKRIINALKPLYLARSISFDYSTWKYNIRFVETEVRRQALLFSTQKSYLWGLYWKGNREGLISSNKRFGQVAVRKGYVSKEDVLKALDIQLDENLHTGKHRLIGRILLEQGLLTPGEVEDILRDLKT